MENSFMSSLYRRIGKRIFDLLIAMPSLVLFSPVLAVVALLVRVKLGAPVFFQQERSEALSSIIKIDV
jgi:lipopolysaccharide/colanic/teichoic acid biosynthesis glycosyltransferase